MSAPDPLHFGIGGFNGPSWDVELKAGVLVVRETRAGYVDGKETIVTPTPEAWSQFWQTAEIIGVWQWQPEYFDHDILDGTQWELELTHAGRTVKCDGSNAYPGANGPNYGRNTAFARFLKTLRTLTGVTAIG